jgi:multidrug efflux system membrane fusion protein
MNTLGRRRAGGTTAGVVGIAQLFITLLFLSGCGQTEANTNPAAAPAAEQKGRGGKGKEGAGAVPVVATQVTKRTVPVEISSVGNVEAYSTISIVAQIGGQLTQTYFNEGDFVRKGERLFSIDPSPIEAQVAQAEANMAKDQALLSQAEANVARDSANQKYAADEAVRYSKLFDEGIISREQTDQLTSNANALLQSIRADQAAVESFKAQIKADQANIKTLRIQLAYTTVVSPIDGRTGNLAVKTGNIVIPGSQVLVTITQVAPIYVTFAIPETHFAEIRRSMTGSTSKLTVVATPQDGAQDQEKGFLTFADNNIDPTTGTIKLKGTFPNTDKKLWPGGFVNVTLGVGVEKDALMVPNQVVQTGQDGNYVYVIKENRTVEMRAVTTGMRVNDDVVIQKGVEAGETVVAEGQLRLTDGSRVQVRGAGEQAPFGNGGGNGKGKGKKRPPSPDTEPKS